MINVSQNEIEIIKKILEEHAKKCNVYAFGSRVKGSARKTSDLDLLFDAQGQRLDFSQIGEIKYAFQESDLPYRVDIVDYNDISENFRKIVDTEKMRIH